MAVSRALNSGLSGRTRKSAGIGTVESCGSASAASGHNQTYVALLQFSPKRSRQTEPICSVAALSVAQNGGYVNAGLHAATIDPAAPRESTSVDEFYKMSAGGFCLPVGN
jgi:hypothetical protein